jgi:hypothetical protein
MAHSRNHNGSAPWDDRDESRHGWLDDVSHRGLDDASRPQPEAEVFALSSSGLPHGGDAESELNESRDDTGEDQSHLGHHAWNSNEDGQWLVGSDDQDDLFQEVSSRPAMFSTHAPNDGENRGGNSLEAEDRTDDGKPAGFSDRESPGSSAHEVRDAGAEHHQANATELQNHLDHSQQALDDDGSDPDQAGGAHEARDGAGDDQQEDAHDADAQDAQALNEHHEEHDSQGQEGSQHCGEQSGNEGLGGQEDIVPAPDGSAHEARDGAGDDQQEDAHDADAQDAQALNEHHEEHDSQGQEGSQHCGEQPGDEGLGGQEDDVPAPDGNAHESASRVDEDHTQDHCNDSQQISDNNDDRDDDESPDHDKDHTGNLGRGRGEHAAQDGDQQGDVHGVDAEDAQEVQQTGNEHHQGQDRQGEDSHHCGNQSDDEGLGAQDDAVAAFLSSDTLAWKETSEWCASAMGTTPDEHDPPHVSSLLEAWGDEGGMHCEAVGQDDTPEVTHTNAFAIGQSDHGLLSL